MKVTANYLHIIPISKSRDHPILCLLAVEPINVKFHLYFIFQKIAFHDFFFFLFGVSKTNSNWFQCSTSDIMFEMSLGQVLVLFHVFFFVCKNLQNFSCNYMLATFC